MPMVLLTATLRRARPSIGGIGGAVIQWEHDGVNVDSFVVDIDGTEYDMGALSPTSGTTYAVAWPEAVESGSHDVVVYAVNEDGRTASADPVTLVKS